MSLKLTFLALKKSCTCCPNSEVVFAHAVTASGSVNFLPVMWIFPFSLIFLCFLSLKLLKLGETGGVKISAWNSGDKSHVCPNWGEGGEEVIWTKSKRTTVFFHGKPSLSLWRVAFGSPQDKLQQKSRKRWRSCARPQQVVEEAAVEWCSLTHGSRRPQSSWSRFFV